MLIQRRAWRECTFHRATLVAACVASLSALLTALIGLLAPPSRVKIHQ